MRVLFSAKIKIQVSLSVTEKSVFLFANKNQSSLQWKFQNRDCFVGQINMNEVQCRKQCFENSTKLTYTSVNIIGCSFV